MQWEKLLSDLHYVPQENMDNDGTQSDYDTIICSTLFRRLQDKAQVFPLDEDDYVRTRLTHSLEVSAIGKKLGEYVFRKLKARGVDPWFESHTEKDFSDVLLCAGLVHDIGNPPFGHFVSMPSVSGSRIICMSCGSAVFRSRMYCLSGRSMI